MQKTKTSSSTAGRARTEEQSSPTEHLLTSTSPPLDLDHSFPQGSPRQPMAALLWTFSSLALQRKEKNPNKMKPKKQRERSLCVRRAAARRSSVWNPDAASLIWCRESEGDGVLTRRPIRFQARRLDPVGSKTPDVLFLLTAWFLYHQNHTGPQC